MYTNKFKKIGSYFSIRDFLLTLLVLLAATVLAFLLGYFSGGENAYAAVVYLVAVVVVSSVTSGYFYGVCASVLGILGVNYFFTIPYFAFNLTRDGYPIIFASMLIAALITSTLTARARQQAQRAREIGRAHV